MNRRAAVQEALVGGGTGLAVVVASIIARSWTGVSDAELLSFAGALVGAGVTVAGSVYVLQWQRNTERREERALLLELLDDVDKECSAFQMANEAALTKYHGRTTKQQVGNVRAAIERVHELRRQIKPKTATMMRALGSLDGLAFDDVGLDEGLGSYAKYPDSADYGHLNHLGHEVSAKTQVARSILKV